MVVLAPLAVGMGIAQAGAGILGAFGAHQSANAQAKAQNQAAANRYKLAIRQQQADWNFTLNKYASQVSQYKTQVKYNNSAAARAYAAEDLNMHNLFKSAAFQQQALAIQAAQTGGAAAAAGKTGRSAQRLDQNVMSQYARNLATQEASLASAQDASSIRRDRIQDKLKISNFNAWAPVSVAPNKPQALPSPQMTSGPSGMSLMTNIGSSLMGGVSGMFSLNNQFNGIQG